MRKRIYRRKRKSSARTQLTRAIKSNLVYVKLRHVLGPYGGPANTWTHFPFAFKFSDIANYSAYSGVFDQYRINAVKLTFTPFSDSADLGNTITTVAPGMSLPRVYTLIDRNGITSGSLSTENQTIENGSTRQIRYPEKPFSIYIKSPGIEAVAENINGTASYGLTQYRKFIDSNNVDVAHYGAGIGWFQPNSNSVGWYYHVVATYYMQFKNVA